MILIEKDDGVLKPCAGVYLITFSDGRFYIGSSKYIPSRVKHHELYMKSGFTTSPSCKTLSTMKGFCGTARISVLEEVELQKDDWRQFGTPKYVLEREQYHIQKNKKNKLMINDPRFCRGTKSISGCIDIELHSRITNMAKEMKKPIGYVVEMLLERGLASEYSVSETVRQSY